MGCATTNEIAFDHNSLVEVSNPEHLSEIEAAWKKRGIKNYTLKYGSTGWVTGYSYTVVVKNSEYQSGTMHKFNGTSQAEDLRSMTIESMFVLAKNKLNQKNYTFYTDPNSEYLVGYYTYLAGADDAWSSVKIQLLSY